MPISVTNFSFYDASGRQIRAPKINIAESNGGGE